MTLDRVRELSTHDGISVHINAEAPIVAEPIVADGADVTPGAIVEFTTDDNECDEAGADSVKAIGYAGPNVRADDPAIDTESDLLTDYAAGERVPVYARSSEFWGIMADQSGSAVEPGTLLKTAADGTLTPVADADNPSVVVCELLGTDAVAPNGSTERVPVRWVK